MTWDSSIATRAIGTVAYGMATVTCALATRRVRGAERKWWIGLLIVGTILLIDLQINARFTLANALSRIAIRGHWYADRAPVQIAFDVGCTAIWLCSGAVALWRARSFGWPLRLALLGIVLAIQLVLLEIVSLHQVDAITYAEVGGLMVVGLGWVLAGGLMAAGAMLRAKKR